MNFTPVLIGGGLQRWSILTKTLPSQMELFEGTSAYKSETEHFNSNFSNIETANDITSDRRLLKVVLGAYGLSEDIDNRHFIKTIMQEGIEDEDSLANKLSDRRYRLLAADFDFSSTNDPKSKSPDLKDRVLQAYKSESFEISVGDIDTDMRLALGFKRALNSISSSATSNASAWFQVLGTPPVKQVIEGALGLPKSFANLSIDEQHQRIMFKAETAFGTDDLSQLAQNDQVDSIVERFLLFKQTKAMSPVSSLQTALVLLQSI